jgi:hypothetical protein
VRKVPQKGGLKASSLIAPYLFSALPRRRASLFPATWLLLWLLRSGFGQILDAFETGVNSVGMEHISSRFEGRPRRYCRGPWRDHDERMVLNRRRTAT